MAERLREVAEIPQQFVKEGSLVSHPLSLFLAVPRMEVLIVYVVH